MKRQTGFGLLEMVLAMALLLVVLVFATQLMTSLERSTVGTQARLNTEAQARAALTLMAEEVELAGSNPTVDSVISAAVGPCVSACTVTVNSGSGIIAGDKVAIGTTSDYETAQVVSVGNGTFTAVLANAHAVGEPVVYPGYPYATGICPPNPSSGGTGCSSTELQFFGNILGTGQLQFVQYVYDSNHKWLTRSITPVTAATKSPAYVLCDNVQAATFIVHTDSEGNNTSVSLTLTVAGPYPDPQTGVLPQVSLQRGMVQARNVAVASNLEASGDSSNVPPSPTGLASLVP